MLSSIHKMGQPYQTHFIYRKDEWMMKTRKLLALLMSLLLVLTVTPFSVTAEDTSRLLIITDDDAASGEGWTWENNVLTLSADVAADAVRIDSGVTSAKVVLEGNVTLNSAALDGVSALQAACDLEIDAGDYTLTLYSGNAVVLAAAQALTLSGGRVYTRSGSNHYRDVSVADGNLTVTDATLVSRIGGIYARGSLVATNAHVSGSCLSEEDDETAGIRIRGGVTATDSTLYANSSWCGMVCGSFTVDNCEISLYGSAEHGSLRVDYREGPYVNTSCISITNMHMYDEKTEDNPYGYEYAVEVFNDGTYYWAEMTLDGEQGWSIEGFPANPLVPAEGKVKELVVGGVNALKYPQGEGWSFNAESGVLTLDNCTITENYVSCYDSTDKDALIYYRGALTIELVGDNYLERTVEYEPAYDSTQFAAIYGDYYYDGEGDTDSPLTIQGTGHLTAGVTFVEGAEEWWLSCQQFAICAVADLSGLRDGGSASVYCGVANVPRAGMFRAFWCSPSYGDVMMLVFNDIEGADENPDGFNWNNNDAWRAEFITGEHYLTAGGKLILNGNTNASGNGWAWADNVLTLAADTPVTSLVITDKVDEATVVLAGDLTLKADGGGYGSTAIQAACDLTIDLNDYNLTVTALDGASAYVFATEPGDMTIRNGRLTVHTAPYDTEWAEQMGSEYEMGIRHIVAAGSMTLKDVNIQAPYTGFVATDLEVELDYDYETGESTYAYYDGGPLTLDNVTIVSSDLYGQTGVSIRNSKVNATSSEYSAIGCSYSEESATIYMADSTVCAACTSEWGWVLEANAVVMDNCQVMFSGATIYRGDTADSVTMTNMTITDPAECIFGETTDYYGDVVYAFLDAYGEQLTYLSNMNYSLQQSRLILKDDRPLSGNGWSWKNHVLTLAEGSEVKAVKFPAELGYAKLVLIGDVTLDTRGMEQENYKYVPAIEAHCDLEIDAGDRTLTLRGYGNGITMRFADLTITGGTVDIATEQSYNPPLAIESVGGGVTIADTTLTTDWEIALNVGWDEAGVEHLSGDLVIRHSVVDTHEGFYVSDGGLTVSNTTLTMTVNYTGTGVHGDILFTDSIVTVSSNEDSAGYLFTSDHGTLTFDNCDLTLSCGESLFRTWYYYEDSTPGSHSAPNMESIRFENMTILTPESYTIVDVRGTDPNGYYCGHTELAGADGTYATYLTATANDTLCQHVYDHHYDSDCNLCGTVREVTDPQEEITNNGGSLSAQVNGVASLFNMEVQGMEVESGTGVADYSFATLDGYKLLEMGTVASNGVASVTVPIRYVYRVEDDFVYYAVRVINVPEDHFDTPIHFLPYFVIEVNGEAVTLYGEEYVTSYNELQTVAFK